MDRFRNGNSMQDKINQLTKENENLKHMVKKQQKKRRWHNIIGIILIVTGLLFLGILAYGEWKGYLSARKVKNYKSRKMQHIMVQIYHCLICSPNTAKCMKQTLTLQDGL